MKEAHSTSGVYSLRPVKVEEVYPLRLLVLRPGGTQDDCHFAGDHDASTFHLAVHDAFQQLVAIASFYENGHPALKAQRPIQLRGMASHPEVRGKGYARALVKHALQLYTLEGADMLWCNAREVAVSFYGQLGFEKIGEPFDIKGIGKHWVMYTALSPQS
jgi:predicted GNAT family N-acyltransferase